MVHWFRWFIKVQSDLQDPLKTVFLLCIFKKTVSLLNNSILVNAAGSGPSELGKKARKDDFFFGGGVQVLAINFIRSTMWSSLAFEYILTSQKFHIHQFVDASIVHQVHTEFYPVVPDRGTSTATVSLPPILTSAGPIVLSNCLFFHIEIIYHPQLPGGFSMEQNNTWRITTA